MDQYSTGSKGLEDGSCEDVEAERDGEGLFVEQRRARWDRETKGAEAAKSNQAKFEDDNKTDSQ